MQPNILLVSFQSISFWFQMVGKASEPAMGETVNGTLAGLVWMGSNKPILNLNNGDKLYNTLESSSNVFRVLCEVYGEQSGSDIRMFQK